MSKSSPGSFALTLKAQRKRLGMTQGQVGSLLPDLEGRPVPERTWQDWELGVSKPPGYAQTQILRVLAAAKPKP